MSAPVFAELSPSTREALLIGLQRFNAHAFWSAHEAWEEAWLEEDGLTKLWLQALIQLTAAFHKGLVMRHPRGMARLLEQSEEKLLRLLDEDASYGGLDLTALLTLAQAARERATRWATGDEEPADLEQLATLALPRGL